MRHGRGMLIVQPYESKGLLKKRNVPVGEPGVRERGRPPPFCTVPLVAFDSGSPLTWNSSHDAHRARRPTLTRSPWRRRLKRRELAAQGARIWS